MNQIVNVSDNVNIEKLATDSSVVSAWCEFLRVQNNLAESTIAMYRRGLKAFAKWMHEEQRAYPTPVDCLAFKQALMEKYSSQTVNLRLSSVRSFYSFLVTSGLCLYNPMQAVNGARRINATRHKRNALSPAEVKRVLAIHDGQSPLAVRNRCVLYLMAYCGLRTIEIVRADFGDLRSEDDRLVLDVQGKGHKEKDDLVIIPGPAEDAIREWYTIRKKMNVSDNDPLFCSLSKRNASDRLSTLTIRLMVKAAFDQVGVIGAGKTTHSLRHSAITQAIKGGASPMQVQAMARHKSYDTTLIYYHENDRMENPAEDLVSY